MSDIYAIMTIVAICACVCFWMERAYRTGVRAGRWRSELDHQHAAEVATDRADLAHPADQLGTFLAEYAEYLDGKRCYTDLRPTPQRRSNP